MNWQEILSWYREDLFLLFPLTSLAISVGAFLFFALPWTFIAWVDPPSLRKYRIQRKDFQAAKWFWPSLGRIAINSTLTLIGIILLWPLLRHTGIHWGELPVWYEVVISLVAFSILDDFLYYWMHRAFHTKFLYRTVHSVHHRPVTPVAIAGNYFHPVEFMATTALMLLGPTIAGSHLVTVWIWIIFRQFQAADGHAGYDIWWNPAHLIPFYHGPAYHDFHHRAFLGNYAGFFPYVDRWFKTYSKGFSSYEKEQDRSYAGFFQRLFKKSKNDGVPVKR